MDAAGVDVANVKITGVEGAVNEMENEQSDANEDDDEAVPERTYQDMKLRSQPQREYNVFHVDGSAAEEMVMLTVGDDNKVCELDMITAEYLFLTETLGWKEGLEAEDRAEMSPNEEKCLNEYLPVTEQMGWRKGLKIFEEKGEQAIMKELKQIHDVEGFQPKHWHELTYCSEISHVPKGKEKRDHQGSGMR